MINNKDVYGEMIGKKFGMLTVIDRPEKGSIKLKCLCDCGTIHFVLKADLKKEKGGTRSCGCNKSKAISKANIERYSDENYKSPRLTHGLSKTPTHNAWTMMKQRCKGMNEFVDQYYLDRGIKYDPRWEDFLNFLEDMGMAPEGTSIDRIDPNGDYCKDNCRWADGTEQSFNQRMKSNNTSGRTGVVWCKRRSKWIARMNINKKQTEIGTFLSFEDACKCREDAELEMYVYTKE